MADRIATDLLRLARDPASGRIRRPARVEVALRAALFADLVFAGRLVTLDRAPAVLDPEPTGDRILDAVHATVAQRAGIVWPRWYRNVRADRAALSRELVTSGRWQRRRTPWPAFDDDDPHLPELAEHVRAVAGGRGELRGPADAVLCLLVTMSGAVGGPPVPRAHREPLGALLTALGDPEQITRQSIEHAVVAAGERIRRPYRSGSMTRPTRRRSLGRLDRSSRKGGS